MPNPFDRSPLGLGWTRWMLSPERTAGLSLRQVFDLQLFVGLAAMSMASLVVAAAVGVVGGHVGLAALFVFANVVQLGLLAAALRGKGPPTAVVRTFLVAGTPLSLVATLLVGGGAVGSGANIAWGITMPVLAMILVGPRFALVQALAIAAGALAITGLVPTPDPLPPSLHWVTAYNVIGTGGSVFIALYWAVQQRQIVEDELAAERAKSDRLIADVLPAPIAERLRHGEVVATHAEDATVLFADVVGFTTLVASLPAGQLLPMLDELFREVDALVERHGLEKIKTIGDCYMVAAGVPEPRADHVPAMAAFAKDLVALVRGRSFGTQRLDVRVGMHCGPVLAGVIGRRRFIYDLWGDTVNTASRMESSGLPGRVQMTEDAAARLRAAGVTVEERGVIEVKGKGPTRTFLLA